MPSKPVDASRVEMTEIVLPQHTNALGTVFGGVVLSWIDIAAAICAQRHCEKIVVTASIDAMHFLAPIRLGWIVNIKASLNFASKKSCEVGVKINSENPLTQEKHHTATAYVTMVAIDDKGKTVEIPAVLPQTAEERRRFAAAEKRRAQRLELKAKLVQEG